MIDEHFKNHWKSKISKFSMAIVDFKKIKNFRKNQQILKFTIKI